MIPVVLASPYAGNRELHVAYAKRAMYDSLLRGEAPFASHLLYTQEGVLDDDEPGERKLGMDAGMAWITKCAMLVVYEDYGLSSGMTAEINRAKHHRIPVVYRRIGQNAVL